MREILFRGKRSDNNVWVEGYYLFLNGEEEKLHIIVDERGIYNKVIPETVGQYTGLTDKNGKKIFEGDIVALRTGRPYEVKYNNGGFELVGTAIPFMHIDKFNLIGNIHDNPELLKGGADNG